MTWHKKIILTIDTDADTLNYGAQRLTLTRIKSQTQRVTLTNYQPTYEYEHQHPIIKLIVKSHLTIVI
jgi:hypothetical protein